MFVTIFIVILLLIAVAMAAALGREIDGVRVSRGWAFIPLMMAGLGVVLIGVASYGHQMVRLNGCLN